MTEPTRRRVLAFGEPAAGDDAAGPAVLEELRRRGVPPETMLAHLRDPSALVSLIEEGVPTIVVDAVLAPPAGRVLELPPDDLAAGIRDRTSSHGFCVAHAIGLARALGAELASLRIVAVTIESALREREGLSPEVAAAVPIAATRILSLLAPPAGEGNPDRSPEIRVKP